LYVEGIPGTPRKGTRTKFKGKERCVTYRGKWMSQQRKEGRKNYGDLPDSGGGEGVRFMGRSTGDGPRRIVCGEGKKKKGIEKKARGETMRSHHNSKMFKKERSSVEEWSRKRRNTGDKKRKRVPLSIAMCSGNM